MRFMVGEGGEKQVRVGNKERQEQRKGERSEESAFTDVFIIHFAIPLTLAVTRSSVEEPSVTCESALHFSECYWSLMSEKHYQNFQWA